MTRTPLGFEGQVRSLRGRVRPDRQTVPPSPTRPPSPNPEPKPKPSPNPNPNPNADPNFEPEPEPEPEPDPEPDPAQVLFSATFPNAVSKLARGILSKPVQIIVGDRR